MQKIRSTTPSKEKLYAIFNQISIKLNATTHPLWIGTVLTDLELDEFKDQSREITQQFENRGFVSTTNIHDGHILIAGISPASFAFIQECNK